MSMRAGTAIVDITPDIGSIMAAFPRGPERQPRRAKEVRDPLYARAFALDDTCGCTVLLACVDLCMVRRLSLARIRKSVSEQLPRNVNAYVTVAATHTHSGAETSFLFGGDPYADETHRIEQGIAEALVQAHGDLEPVTMAWGRTACHITHNRRVVGSNGRANMVLEYSPGTTEGPVDPDVTTVRFDRPDGTPKAVIVHFTAHALTLGPRNDAFSADYPGYLCRLLEEALPRCRGMFLNGATGNVHPRECMRAGPEALEHVGRALEQAALTALRNLKTPAKQDLSAISETLVFPNRMDATRRVQVEIAMLRLGDLVLGLVPGEFFVEFQLRFKTALAPLAGTLAGYANGWPGYVPTREAYAQGGYGVDPAHGDPPEYSRTALSPGAGEYILDKLLKLAAQNSHA